MLESLWYGTDACVERIKAKDVSLLIVCEDASLNTKEKMKRLSEKYNIPLLFYEKIENLSRAIGKINKAVFAVIEKGFADTIIKLINESKEAIN